MEFVYIIGFGLLVAFAIAWNLNAMVGAAFALALLVEPIASMIFPKLQKLDYAVTMLFFWIWLIVIARIIIGKVEAVAIRPPKPIALFLLFLFSAALGSAYAMQFAQALVGAKGYFQAWAIPFIFYFLLKDERSVLVIGVAFLVLAAFQPFVAGIQAYLWHGQPFFGDRLGGTFGNTLGTGALMSAFQVTQILVIMALMKHRCIRPIFGASLVIWVFTPLLWTHAKAVVVLMPVGLMVLFWSEIRERPVYALRFVAMGLALVGFLAFQYYMDEQYYRGSPVGAPESFDAFIDQSLGYAVLGGGAELNRGTSLVYWWEMHSLLRNPLETLVGHGMGSAKEYGVVQGHLLTDPEYGRAGMGKAFARLLWEVGIIGAIGLVGALTTTATAAKRLSRDARIPDIHRAFLAGYSAVAVMLIVQMLWRADMLESVTFGTFTMFTVGYVLYWIRVTKGYRDDHIPQA
ncbi:MAG: hypothetical protein KFB96_07640 [Thiocapsa sp.]|uniref:hypothetical protein n=1 Tax=Thiocapsa sp. TaxID=2024551 RepID=UPI001BCF9A54|nr:hypothetical protein [Thiocapsa sp.]QVL50298.1 MAG: hypothetical protein KFB96_07640 [Thiocapsa sp.]